MLNKARLPAEWEEQAALLIIWPHRDGDFAHQISEVEACYQRIAETVCRYQTLYIICKNNAHQRHIAQQLPEFNNYIQADYDDIWIRDTGPITLQSAKNTYCLNFQFNGWGNKYPHQSDAQLNSILTQSLFFKHMSFKDCNFVLEGGSIECDGAGSLLATRNCLLNSNRNPQYNQQEIERKLQDYLHINRILWLQQDGLAGDDTDAHIDTLARFVAQDHIAYSSCEDPVDLHYASLQNMRNQLQTFSTVDGKPYRLTPLPLPKPVFDKQGQQLPANYANFIIINHAVLLPVYNDPMDDIARQRLRWCFPDREIIPIACLPIVQQYGSLHCMSMHVSKAAP